jgi:hypothetical protein
MVKNNSQSRRKYRKPGKLCCEDGGVTDATVIVVPLSIAAKDVFDVGELSGSSRSSSGRVDFASARGAGESVKPGVERQRNPRLSCTIRLQSPWNGRQRKRRLYLADRS